MVVRLARVEEKVRFSVADSGAVRTPFMAFSLTQNAERLQFAGVVRPLQEGLALFWATAKNSWWAVFD